MREQTRVEGGEAEEQGRDGIRRLTAALPMAVLARGLGPRRNQSARCRRENRPG